MTLRVCLVQITIASRAIESCFFAKHYFLKKSVFLPLSRRKSGRELKKIAYPSFLPHLFLLSIHEVVGEAVLSNSFSKIAQLYLESCL